MNPLKLLGWAPIESRIAQEFNAHKKIVFIYPHSSPWDMVLAMAYLYYDDTFKEVRKRVCMPVLGETFDTIPILPLLADSLGLVPITKGGSLQRIYDKLDKMDSFFVIISPKGSMAQKPWRSGWYNIAKKYDATVMVGGMDYYTHKVRLERVEKINGRSNEKLERELKPAFADITPMRYERETNLIDIRKPSQNVISGGLLAFYLLVIIVAISTVLFVVSRLINNTYEAINPPPTNKRRLSN